jgi:hypothetical protein
MTAEQWALPEQRALRELFSQPHAWQVWADTSAPEIEAWAATQAALMTDAGAQLP